MRGTDHQQSKIFSVFVAGDVGAKGSSAAHDPGAFTGVGGAIPLGKIRSSWRHNTRGQTPESSLTDRELSRPLFEF